MSWQKNLGQGFKSLAELLRYLELPLSIGNLRAEEKFPSRIPLSFAKRMQKGNPRDPLLLQVLATEDELGVQKGYGTDPLNENNSNPLPGLIHKYYGRVLLTLTGVCAVNCRYCFRRSFPYQLNNPGRQGFKDICDYIAKDNKIFEVILSGGDPLLATNSTLEELIQLLEKIPHLHTVRIHTRIPVVFPERVDMGLLAILNKTRLKKVLVLHCNHPQELDDSLQQVLYKLNQSGCHLLNQTVLLAGINDTSEILFDLSQKLFHYGVLPYYLHLLDKVEGAAHFDMPFIKAQHLYQELQNMLPGYLLPKLVREEPGKLSKTLLV